MNIAIEKIRKLTTLIYKLGFIPCEAEQPLFGMELQGKEVHKD